MQVKDFKPGETYTFPGFIWLTAYGGTPTWAEAASDMSTHGWTKIMRHDLQFTVPVNFNAVVAEVNSIDNALEAAASTYHNTVAGLRDRKNALLQIGHSQPEILDADPAAAPMRMLEPTDFIDCPF